MMIGMSLAYSLYHANEVNNAVQDAQDFELPAVEPVKETLPLCPQPHALDPANNNYIPLENALAPYVPPQENKDNNENEKEEITFDLLDIFNDMNEQEMVLGATQMERQFSQETSETTTASLIRKCTSPVKTRPFANCKIGSIGTININIYKKWAELESGHKITKIHVTELNVKLNIYDKKITIFTLFMFHQNKNYLFHTFLKLKKYISLVSVEFYNF